MAFRLKNPNVISETVELRVVKDGHVDQWLVVATNLEANSPAMQNLIVNANALLSASPNTVHLPAF